MKRRQMMTAGGLAGFGALVAGDTATAAIPASLKRALEGSWELTISPTAPIPPIRALATFQTSGEVTGSLGQPFTSSGHGSWERFGPGKFAVSIRYFRFDSEGTLLGATQVNGNVAAASANRLTGQFEAKLVDTEGNVTTTIVGEGQAVRIPAEGLP